MNGLIVFIVRALLGAMCRVRAMASATMLVALMVLIPASQALAVSPTELVTQYQQNSSPMQYNCGGNHFVATQDITFPGPGRYYVSITTSRTGSANYNLVLVMLDGNRIVEKHDLSAGESTDFGSQKIDEAGTHSLSLELCDSHSDLAWRDFSVLYYAVPTATSLSPATASTAGDTVVTIYGSDFVAGETWVQIGNTLIAKDKVTVESDSKLSFVAPAHTPGTLAIGVLAPGGYSEEIPGGITYATPPSISSVSPDKGTAYGNVTISGLNLTGAAVTFGGASAQIISNNDTSILVSAPTHAAGLVDVVVTTSGGSATATNGFKYLSAPAFTSVTPDSGPSTGGTPVTIHGSNFDDASTVAFGASVASDLVVVSDSQITVTSPPGTGTVDVSVTTPAGTTSYPAAFSYIENGSITIRQVTSGGDGSFAFASATPALNFSIATSGGAGEAGPLTLPAGDYTITATQASGFGLTDVSCTAGGVGNSGDGSASLSLGAGDAITCTFASTNSEAAATGLIQDFFAAQGAVILSNLPDGQRRLDRLQGVTPLPGSPVPALVGYMGDAANGALQLPALSGSLAQIDAITGKPQSPFDIWFQATLGQYQAGELSGRFGIVSVGADYLVNDSLLLGGFLQADIEPDADNGAGGSISGKGWLAGSYLTARLGDGLYLDVLAGAGAATNSISPDGSYSDTFDASRWLASAALSGQIQFGDWTISPTARVSYFQSTSEAYLDGLGVDIPSVTGGLGQIALGPILGYRFALDSGVMVNTTLDLAGVVEIAVADDDASTELHGRVKAGVSLTTPEGASFGVSAGLDGLGGGTAVQALSGNLNLAVPIN